MYFALCCGCDILLRQCSAKATKWFLISLLAACWKLQYETILHCSGSSTSWWLLTHHVVGLDLFAVALDLTMSLSAGSAFFTILCTGFCLPICRKRATVWARWERSFDVVLLDLHVVVLDLLCCYECGLEWSTAWWFLIRKVSHATLANATLVLSSKNWKKETFEMGDSICKIDPKSLGPAFSLCRRAGTDAALVKAQFFFHRRTPHRK